MEFKPGNKYCTKLGELIFINKLSKDELVFVSQEQYDMHENLQEAIACAQCYKMILSSSAVIKMKTFPTKRNTNMRINYGKG